MDGMTRPYNNAAQWACLLGAVLALAVWALPEPSATPILCPNYAIIHVHDAHWDSAKRTKRIVRTLPATCGDTTAVTYGYLR